MSSYSCSDEYNVLQVQSALTIEEYDSDSLNLDVADDNDSNISKLIDDEAIYHLIKDYAYGTKCM